MTDKKPPINFQSPEPSSIQIKNAEKSVLQSLVKDILLEHFTDVRKDLINEFRKEIFKASQITPLVNENSQTENYHNSPVNELSTLTVENKPLVLNNTNIKILESKWDPIVHKPGDTKVSSSNVFALMAKLHKSTPDLTNIMMWFQYFLVVNCKKHFHLDWKEKKQTFTRSELLLALTIDSSVLGKEHGSLLQNTWIRHLNEHSTAYFKASQYIKNFAITGTTPDRQKLLNLRLQELTRYLNADEVVFRKPPKPLKTEGTDPTVKEVEGKRTVDSEEFKSYQVKNRAKDNFNNILIKVLSITVDTFCIELPPDPIVWQQYWEITDYPIKCKDLVTVAVTVLDQRAELRAAKNIKLKVNPVENI
jgi:hypothetical protein